MVKNLLQKAIDKVWHATHDAPPTNMVSIDTLEPYNAYAGQQQSSPWENSIMDGSKFAGGFGTTQLQYIDYWTLRARSAQLYNDNLYARGLIRRLITNEINTGVVLEATPDEGILGVEEDSLNEWSENTENRFNIWGKNPKVCDWKESSTFAALQRAARTEALVEGDVLVVVRQSQRTRLPQIQLVKGSKVQTPLGGKVKIRQGHDIVHGVEMDVKKKVVAHWIRQEDGSSKRQPAFGEKTGRRVSWLVYGTDKRMDDVRGQPLLSLVLQSLKEIDRYRDSVQRKAVLNSFLAMFIRKTDDKPGTLPISGGAVRRDSASVTDSDGTTRSFDITKHIPGMILEELQTGEEPVGFDSKGTDTDFGTFEEAIIQAVAWANEVPPEILRLAFSSNYSASQAAINEFKIYLARFWSDWGETFCTPIYIEWLISETLLRKIKAPGLLQAWRDISQHDIFGAWTLSEWYGSVKPSTDMLKQAKGSKMLVDEAWSTNTREARNLSGSNFGKNAKRLRRENELKVEAMRPLAEFQKEFAEAEPDNGQPAALDHVDLEATLDDYLEEKGVQLSA